jgi:hypothetical protein
MQAGQDWCDDNGPRVVEWTAVLARPALRLNVGDMGRCIPIARMRPVKMCPVLSFSQAMVDKFTARAVRGIAVDIFDFSPSGGAMSGVALAVWFPDPPK